jgi:outer membrane lipoprotein-sorting protein
MSSEVNNPRSLMERNAGTPRRGAATRVLSLPALAGVWLASMVVLADPTDTGLDSTLAALAQRRHGHALYSERIESALFKRPLATSGELFFDAPDRLEKKTLQPVPEDLLVDGDVVTIVRGTHRTSMRLSDYPQLSPLLNGMRATLAGDRSTLERNFQLAFQAAESGWALTLQPLPSDTKPLYQRIQIHGVGGTVLNVALERASGERTTMTLSEAAQP